MRYIICCCTAALLLACAGCAPPPFWVKGLSLPAGATVVSQSETTNVQGMAGMLPLKGKVDKVLTVSFDCPGDWAAVSSHIDGCMTGQGYTDQVSSLAGMAGGMPGAAGASALFSSMRMYGKDGAKYTVMLMDMGGAMAAASKVTGQSAPGMGKVPGMGTYSMSVIRTK